MPKKIKLLTQHNDILEEKNHTNNQQTYSMKKRLNANGHVLPIASSEFCLDESERKTITEQVKAQPDYRSNADLIQENGKLKQEISLHENQNRLTNEKGYRTKKDLEKQGFPAPMNSSEFNLDEPTRKLITDQVEKDHASRYQCDSGISDTKRPRFPSRSATPDNHLKNNEHSDSPDIKVQSPDFFSTLAVENKNGSDASLQPGAFSSEFPGILDDLKELNDQN